MKYLCTSRISASSERVSFTTRYSLRQSTTTEKYRSVNLFLYTDEG